MLAGPAAISTVMVLIGESRAWWEHFVAYAAILISSLASYLILAGADRVRSFLGETGVRILMRLMGLISVAIAVQFIERRRRPRSGALGYKMTRLASLASRIPNLELSCT